MSKSTKKTESNNRKIVFVTIINGIKSNNIFTQINKIIDDYSENFNAYSNLMEYFSCEPDVINPKNPFNNNNLVKTHIASGIEIPGALISLKFYQNNFDVNRTINPDEVFTNFDGYYDNLIKFEKISKDDAKLAKKQIQELSKSLKDLLSGNASKDVIESCKNVNIPTLENAISVLQGIETFNTFANEHIKMIKTMGKDGYKKFQIEKIQKAMIQTPRKKGK